MDVQLHGPIGHALVGTVGSIFIPAHGGIDIEALNFFEQFITLLQYCQKRLPTLGKRSLQGLKFRQATLERTEIALPVLIAWENTFKVPGIFDRNFASI